MTLCPEGDWAGRLTVDTSYGSLAIDGISLFRPAWTITSLASLYDDPAQRGGDRLLPGVIGVKAYRRRVTVTRRSLPFQVTGYVDAADVIVADPFAQLRLNLAYLRANVTLPTNVGEGTRTAVLTLPDGTTVTKDLHVLGIHGDLLPGALWVGLLELSDPTGQFHA